jgi:hypothetical protein
MIFSLIIGNFENFKRDLGLVESFYSAENSTQITLNEFKGNESLEDYLKKELIEKISSRKKYNY